MGAAVNGARGGRPVVMASRFTHDEERRFLAKAPGLTKAQALRLAVLEWPGLSPDERLSDEARALLGM